MLCKHPLSAPETMSRYVRSFLGHGRMATRIRFLAQGETACLPRRTVSFARGRSLIQFFTLQYIEYSSLTLANTVFHST